jgi:hypothetical protein
MSATARPFEDAAGVAPAIANKSGEVILSNRVGAGTVEVNASPVRDGDITQRILADLE